MQLSNRFFDGRMGAGAGGVTGLADWRAGQGPVQARLRIATTGGKGYFEASALAR